MLQARALRSAASLSLEDRATSAGLDIQMVLADLCQGFEQVIDPQRFAEQIQATLSEHCPATEFWQALILDARAQIEYEPAYTFVAALAKPVTPAHTATLSQQRFPLSVRRGVEAGLLDPRLLNFDLSHLAQALHTERDLLFAYPGLQTLYDRYFLQQNQQRVELPQWFWMRVAMGVALNEANKWN